MKITTMIAVLLLAAGVDASLHFTVSTNVDEVMTMKERKAFGIDRFDAEKRQAFQIWLAGYALRTASAIHKAAECEEDSGPPPEFESSRGDRRPSSAP
jgi:hypothetical protein